MTRTNRLIALRALLIVIIATVMIIPMLYMVIGSLKSQSEIVSYPQPLLPDVPIWGNYLEAFEHLTARTFVNTAFMSIGIILLQFVLALPAAFVLAKMRFRWSRQVLALLLVPMFVPGTLTLIPTFVITHWFGWLNSYAGLIIPVACQVAFAVLLFRQFIVGLPDGLIEAARVDGASWVRVLASIILPLARPAIATYFSISFLTSWNSYLWPLVVAPDPTHRVLNVALAPLASGTYTAVSPSVGLAAAVITVIPVLLIFIVFQRWYINGVAGTGLN